MTRGLTRRHRPPAGEPVPPAAAPAPAPAAAGRPAPLLVACALGIERLALVRAAAKDGLPSQVTVVRTGMGPQAARRALARALREEEEPGSTAVAVTGFCAGLLPGMHPGDLVLAEETRAGDVSRRGAASFQGQADPRREATQGAPASGAPASGAGRTACTGSAALARALAPLGTVHTGPLACSGHLVRGRQRAALRGTGAIAVDMESAVALSTAVAGAPGRPVTAVRVVVDAPGHELLRIGTLGGGISAFRVLSTLLPAFLAWHRSLPLSRR